MFHEKVILWQKIQEGYIFYVQIGDLHCTVAQMVKNLPAMQETQVRSLGWEDSLEKEWQPFQYSCLESPMDRGDWRATVHGVAKELDTTE